VSANSHSLSQVPGGADVLGELLHSLSQPLTSLRCSLEFSIEQVAEQQQASVVAALQETERVIGMIQLMREYLEADGDGSEVFSSALAPELRSVIEDLSSVADVRGVQLSLLGACTAALPVAESRLRLALQYLLTGMIETQAAGGKVLLKLDEGEAGAVLRGAGEWNFGGPSLGDREPSASSPRARREPSRTAPASTLHRVRLAIASRVFEMAGATLVFDGADGPCGFVLRIPHRR
jgi:hypothetical protein